MPRVSGTSRCMPDVGMKLPKKQGLPAPLAAPVLKTEAVASASAAFTANPASEPKKSISQIITDHWRAHMVRQGLDPDNPPPRPVSTGSRVPRPSQRCGHYLVEPKMKQLREQFKKQ